MLFRSLSDRLLGGEEAQNTKDTLAGADRSRFSYKRHPGLLELLVDLVGSTESAFIASPMSESFSDALFPALDILLRAPPPMDQRTAISEYVLRASGNPIWHVRVIAARAFAAFNEPRAADGVRKALSGLDRLNGNALHGRLLCVRQLVEYTARRKAVGLLNDMLLAITDNVNTIRCADASGTIHAAYLDIVNVIGLYVLTYNPAMLRHSHGKDDLIDHVRQEYVTLSKALQSSVKHESVDSALVRQSHFFNLILTHLISQQAEVQPSEDLSSVVQAKTLARTWAQSQDVDATIGALSRLLQEFPDVSTDLSLCMMELMAQTYAGSPHTEVQTSMQAVIVGIFRIERESHRFFENPVICEFLANLPILHEMSSTQPPSDFQTRIICCSIVLRAKFHIGKHWTGQTHDEMGAWIRCVRAALTEQIVSYLLP